MKKHSNQKQQAGVILVISLIMLLLLTIIGVTSMQVTGLEEKMAGNYRDHNIAFQAAETALRGGEAKVESIVALGAFDGSNGLLGIDDTNHDFSDANIWSGTNSIQFTSGLNGIKSEPRFYIKYKSTSEDDSSAKINISSYGNHNAAGSSSYFIITARGTGGSDSSQVFLRSYYTKKF